MDLFGLAIEQRGKPPLALRIAPPLQDAALRDRFDDRVWPWVERHGLSCEFQFTLMSAALITCPQRARSLSICALNCAGELPTGSMICAANFAFSSGELSALDHLALDRLYYRVGRSGGARSGRSRRPPRRRCRSLSQRWHARQQRRALRSGYRQHLHRAGFDMRQHRDRRQSPPSARRRGSRPVIACGEEP